MGRIQINTPTGLIGVNIAGDVPTDEEKEIIFNFINTPDFGFDADEEEDKKKKEDDTKIELDTSKIDYKSGIRDLGLRANVARGDNLKEKILRLNRAGIPQEAIAQDKKGELILDRDLIPDDVKEKYNITGSGLVAFDESAIFTKADFAEFFSKESGPLLGGITAGLAASGFGLIPAAIIAGGGSTLGYLFDEGLEEVGGLREENFKDLISGSAFEFSVGAIGETGGRLLTKFFGRLLKGSGGESANDARTFAREVIKDGASPTVKAINESAILGRLQAIYEGVFPNKKAAEANAKFVSNTIAKSIQASGLKGTSANADEVFKLIQRDLDKIYGTSDDLIKQANNNLNQLVNKEINKLNDLYKQGSLTETEVIEALQTSKRIFDEDTDAIFAEANSFLKNKEYIDTGPLYTKFKELVDLNPASGLEDSIVGRLILGTKNPKTGAFKGGFKLGENKYALTNISTMKSIKNALRNTEFDPSLIGTPEKAILTKILQAVDYSTNKANLKLTTNPLSFGFGADEVSNVKKGLDLISKGEKFYEDGIKTFQTPISQNLTKKFLKNDFDPEQLLEEVIIPKRGESLQKFLDSIQGVKSQQIVPAQAGLDFSTFVKNKYGLDITDFDAIPEDDVLKKSVISRFESIQELSNKVQAARGQGQSVKEAVRQTLARKYLERMFSENRNAFGDLSASGVADKIAKLGNTGKVLFGKEYTDVMKSLQDISSSGQKLTPDQIARLKGLPIADQVDQINSITQSKKQISNEMLMRSLSTAINQGNIEGITDIILRPGRRGATLVRQAKQSLGDDTMDAIKESALNRILSDLPDPNTGGKEFIEKVFDGSYSTQLKQVLKGYDDNVLKELLGDGADVLQNLARQSEVISQKPISGLGGLVAATTITSLGIGAYFTTGILAPLGLAAGLKFMSWALRTPFVVKLLSRPTGIRPGSGEYDKLGRAIEMYFETTGQVAAQQTQGYGIAAPLAPDEPEESAQLAPVIPTSRLEQTAMNVQPPSAASSANINLLATNPIVIPNPRTQALAQALQGRK